MSHLHYIYGIMQCLMQSLYDIFRSRTAGEINCTTSSVSSTSASGEVVVQIDDEIITEEVMNYTYRNNPNFTSVSPQLIIPA